MAASAGGLAPLERALFGIVAATCLLFAILTPPFQAPDEPQHLSKAWQLAHGHLFAQHRGTAIGGAEPMGYARLSERDFPREAFEVASRFTPDRVLHAMRFRQGDDASTFIEFANVGSYAPALYVPQMVAIATGDAAGLPPLLSFYLARLCNVLVFLALLYGAVRALPFGRPALLAVAALPTVAYQAASLSPDATINGVAWLSLALSLRVAADRSTRGVAPIAAAVPLGLAKGLYSPLVLAGARPATWRPHAIGFLCAVAAFVGWTLVAGGDQPVYAVVLRKTGVVAMTAPASEQLRVVLAAPAWFARVLAASVAERSPVYLLQIVGRFGWNAILLPLACYPLALAMLAAGIAAGLGRPVHRLARLWWLAIAAGGAVLVEVALYLTGTPLGADYVQGVQGRYFLPLLPLVAFALAPARKRRGALRPALAAAALLNVLALATAVDSFWIHGFTSHHGLPPIGHGATGLLRALLLPSPRW